MITAKQEKSIYRHKVSGMLYDVTKVDTTPIGVFVTLTDGFAQFMLPMAQLQQDYVRVPP